MKRYMCKKSFCVDEYDADGFPINGVKVIEEGEEYELEERGGTITGGEVHLEAVDGGSWLEMSKEELKTLFELVEGDIDD